jgi:hypothetical protein
MIPDIVREYAKQLALEFVSRALRQRLPAHDFSQLEAWAMTRLAGNDYELLRTTKLSGAARLVQQLLTEYRNLPAARSRVGTVSIERGFSVRVRCLDVEVGRATLDRAVGLAHTTLRPSSDYPMIAPFAQAMGDWLAVRHYWTPADGDVTDIVGEVWRGERLGLEDHLGRELSVAHVIVAERRNRSYKAPEIQLIADFRPDYARVAAIIPTSELGSGSRRGLSA